MTWRDGLDAWREFDTRHPGTWRTGVVGLLGGSAFAVLIALKTIAASPRTLHVLIAALAVMAVVFGRRLFWNDRERRLRALFRIVGLLVLIRLVFSLGKYAGLPLNRTAMFAGGSLSMALGSATIALIFTVAVVVAVRLFDRRPIRELGVVPGPAWWGDLTFGLWLGVLLMTMVFGIEYAAGWLRVRDVAWTAPPDKSFPLAMLNMTVVFLTVGYYEELTNRGYLLRALAQGFVGRLIPATWAIVIATVLSSAVFGLGHLGNPNATWVSTVNIVLAGVVLALPYILTGRLAGSIGLHITWNLFQGCVYGLPVSGLAAPVSVLHIEQLGPASWTGGPFGPEAGLLGVLAMAMGAALIIGRERGRRGRATLYTGLVEPAVPTLAA